MNWNDDDDYTQDNDADYSQNYNYNDDNIGQFDTQYEPGMVESPDSGSKNQSGKILFFAMLAGVLLIVVAIFGNNLLNSVKNGANQDVDKDVTKPPTHVSTDVGVNNNVDVGNKPNTSTDTTNTGGSTITIGKPVGNTDVELVPDPYNPKWLPFKVEYYGEQSPSIESTFTISNIEGFAKDNGSNGVLKHIVYGSIKGLDGVYELEIGYDIANKLAVGQSFKVWYHTIDVGGETFVSNITTTQDGE